MGLRWDSTWNSYPRYTHLSAMCLFHSVIYSVSHLIYLFLLSLTRGFPDGSVGKVSLCSLGDTGDMGLIPGLGTSSGGRNGNPIQYSCLGKFQWQRRLVGYSPWGHKKSDITEHMAQSLINSCQCGLHTCMLGVCKHFGLKVSTLKNHIFKIILNI